MNLAVSCGTASGFAADCFGDISACANAPETISALTAAEIISVLSIMGLLSSLFRQGKEAFLVENNSPGDRVFRAFGTCLELGVATERRAFAHLQSNGLSEMQPLARPPERNEKPGLFKDGRTNARDGNSTLTISGGQALRAIGR